MATSPLSLKARVLRLLGGRDYTRDELERKLVAHAQAPGELARILDELEAKGFISAQRVVESVIHRRAPRLGVARIRHELQQKGLDSALVQQALASLQATELPRAREVWRKKFGASRLQAGGVERTANPVERARQMRFLASRGFATDTIRRVVDAAGDDDLSMD
jgi:regulatory protein